MNEGLDRNDTNICIAQNMTYNQLSSDLNFDFIDSTHDLFSKNRFILHTRHVTTFISIYSELKIIGE